MKQKQSIVIFVKYKDNNDTTTTTANKSIGFDPSAIQSCLDSRWPNCPPPRRLRVKKISFD